MTAASTVGTAVFAVGGCCQDLWFTLGFACYHSTGMFGEILAECQTAAAENGKDGIIIFADNRQCFACNIITVENPIVRCHYFHVLGGVLDYKIFPDIA